MALTAKQALFVKEYLVDLNATGAAIRAGYSEKTATIIGHENLRKPNIAEAISEAQKEHSKAVTWTVEEILRDLKEIATDKAQQTKDRNKAYELGGKHLGMFTDKIEYTGQTTSKIDLTGLSIEELKAYAKTKSAAN